MNLNTIAFEFDIKTISELQCYEIPYVDKIVLMYLLKYNVDSTEITIHLMPVIINSSTFGEDVAKNITENDLHKLPIRSNCLPDANCLEKYGFVLTNH
jgi:hypothetical protein